MQKKKILAAALAAAMALSAPLSVSAAWQRDAARNWQWSENGALQTGWKQISGKWYHFDRNGIMNTGWLHDGGTWYYLDASGAMKTGWLLDKGSWYYLNPNGAMAVGWKNVNGQWYYLQSWGGMQTGWLRDSGNTYYLDSWGAMAQNWRLVDGSWYYMNADGIRQTGWTEVNGKRYFLDADGAMQTGLIEVDGEVYYLDESGAMVTGKVQIDGKRYEFAETGESVGFRTPESEKAFDTAGHETEITVDGGLSGGGGGSSGGGGSTGGSGSSGGSGGSGGDGGAGGGEVGPPEEEIKIDVDGGTWKDTEEGIRFTTDEGTYMSGYFLVAASRLDYFMADSYLVQRFLVDDLFVEDSQQMTGTLFYYLPGEEINSSSDEKEANLVESSFDSETGIVSLHYQGLDIDITFRLKVAQDRKSVTLLDYWAKDLVEHSESNNIQANVNLNVLPDSTVAVKDEQDMRDALANERITEIIINNDIDFSAPLVIDRDIQIVGGRKHKLQPADTWQDEEKALISIQNNAKVRFVIDGDNFSIRSGNNPNLTLIEIKNGSLEAEGVEFANDDACRRIMYLENATVKLYRCYLGHYNNTEIGIELDTTAGSKSNLEIIDTSIANVEKQIISGSPDSNVILPNGYTEFTNGEGQREWTNDPDKLPQPPEETENPQEPAETDSAVTE